MEGFEEVKRQLKCVLKVIGNLYLKLNDKLWGEKSSAPNYIAVDNISKLTSEFGMKLKCQRCGHSWIKTTINMPRKCPQCKSPHWNKTKWKGVDT